MAVRHRLTLAVAALALLICAGCGGRDLPELAPVEGTVTLDHLPLGGVLVSFYPSAGGRPGSGVTDDKGHYELVYLDGEEGTKLGPNRVEVTTIWPDGEPGPGEVDTIPAAYNGMGSTLKFDVQAEDNTFDIDMETSTADTADGGRR